MISEAPYFNEPILYLNDSIIVFTGNLNDTLSKDFGSIVILKMNINTGELLSKIRFYNSKDNLKPLIFSSTQVRNGRFQLGIRDNSTRPYINHIYDIDTGLNLVNHLVIPYPSMNTVVARWISRDDNSNYEIITDTHERKNEEFIGTGFMTYFKLGKDGSILKSKVLRLSNNFLGWTGGIYAVKRDSMNCFIIGRNERGLDSLTNVLAPYVIKISPEFDSILKIRKIYPFNQLIEFPSYELNFMDRTFDHSGYIFCGDISNIPHLPQFRAFGLIFKVDNNADSLWSRSYIPLSWDTSRVSQCNFRMIHST